VRSIFSTQISWFVLGSQRKYQRGAEPQEEFFKYGSLTLYFDGA